MESPDETNSNLRVFNGLHEILPHIFNLHLLPRGRIRHGFLVGCSLWGLIVMRNNAITSPALRVDMCVPCFLVLVQFMDEPLDIRDGIGAAPRLTTLLLCHAEVGAVSESSNTHFPCTMRGQNGWT